jgi:hypothetical protein
VYNQKTACVNNYPFYLMKNQKSNAKFHTLCEKIHDSIAPNGVWESRKWRSFPELRKK